MEKVSHQILHSGFQAKQSGVPDDYVTRLVKYIPAEIVAAFLVIDGILKAVTGVQANLYWLIFIVLLILTPLYTWRVTTEAGLPVAYVQVVVSTLSFIVWVFAIGGPFSLLSWYQPVYGSILLILFTLIPPLAIGK
jgi:hypothetical protein